MIDRKASEITSRSLCRETGRMELALTEIG